MCDSLLLVVFTCLYVLSYGQGPCLILYDSHRTSEKEKQKFESQLKFLPLSTLNDISHVYIFSIPNVKALTLAYYFPCGPCYFLLTSLLISWLSYLQSPSTFLLDELLKIKI